MGQQKLPHMKGNKNMLKLQLTLDKIDYDKLIDLLLPALMYKLAESDDPKLRILSALPMKIAKTTLISLPDERKEEIAALLLERYKDRLADSLRVYAERQGLYFELRDVKADRV